MDTSLRSKLKKKIQKKRQWEIWISEIFAEWSSPKAINHLRKSWLSPFFLWIPRSSILGFDTLKLSLMLPDFQGLSWPFQLFTDYSQCLTASLNYSPSSFVTDPLSLMLWFSAMSFFTFVPFSPHIVSRTKLLSDSISRDLRFCFKENYVQMKLLQHLSS